MNKILALWAVPRSRSTAFEHMMRTRSDHVCLHEPFGEAWYQGEDRRCPPQHSRGPTPGLTFASVWKHLRATASSGDPVFMKEFPHHVEHMWDEAFLSHFTHSFLIRDPVKTLPSIYDKWPDFELVETGFVEQRALFDRIANHHGSPPPVIDAEDLVADPPGVVGAWCDAVGIPFQASALSWDAPSEEAHSWYDDGSWHDNLRASTGLEVPAREYLPVDTNKHLRETYEYCLPHYQVIYQHRLGV